MSRAQVEAALLGLSSCVNEAIVLNCARTGVKLEGLDVKAHAEIDPGQANFHYE